MIDISKYINSDKVVTDISASTKKEVIKLLVDKIYSSTEGKLSVSKEKACEEVIKREALQSTGIGNELAFPHARIEGWGEFTVAMGALKEGIDFNSMDGKPVKFVFLMISSTEEPYMILQAMSAIIRFLGNMGHNGDLMKDPIKMEDILALVREKDMEVDEQILARDIVRPIEDFVTMKTLVEDVTHKMHLKRISTLPVVHDDDRFCGEITCFDIFSYGMPDFFKQLKTVSFIRHVDPFEKYFSIKRDLRVMDLPIKAVTPVKEDDTLLEIIFKMTVEKRSKLFMVDDKGVLAGVIDRFCVIDKILFF